jgi:hypothetical protein
MGTQSKISVILREVLPTEESAFIVVRVFYDPILSLTSFRLIADG